MKILILEIVRKALLQNLMFDCFEFKPVTALAASFGSVRRSRIQKMRSAYFLKEAKAAALQLRSPPAVEAKAVIR